MWLTDEEFMEFARDLSAVYLDRLANAPGKGRRRRMIYTISVPGSQS
jgi:hypothetical protein